MFRDKKAPFTNTHKISSANDKSFSDNQNDTTKTNSSIFYFLEIQKIEYKLQQNRTAWWQQGEGCPTAMGLGRPIRWPLGGRLSRQLRGWPLGGRLVCQRGEGSNRHSHLPHHPLDNDEEHKHGWKFTKFSLNHNRRLLVELTFLWRNLGEEWQQYYPVYQPSLSKSWIFSASSLP